MGVALVGPPAVDLRATMPQDMPLALACVRRDHLRPFLRARRMNIALIREKQAQYCVLISHTYGRADLFQGSRRGAAGRLL